MIKCKQAYNINSKPGEIYGPIADNYHWKLIEFMPNGISLYAPANFEKSYNQKEERLVLFCDKSKIKCHIFSCDELNQK